MTDMTIKTKIEQIRQEELLIGQEVQKTIISICDDLDLTSGHMIAETSKTFADHIKKVKKTFDDHLTLLYRVQNGRDVVKELREAAKVN